MSIYTMIYAVVAIGLVVWLRSLLGTRHGAERERVHPIILAEQNDNTPAEPDAAVSDQGEADPIAALAAAPPERMGIEASAVEGLRAIAGKERDFNVETFIAAATDTFVIVTEDFAKGDIVALRDLLADAVLEVFGPAIDKRAARGHVMETQIRAVSKSEVLDAAQDGRKARITVRFAAEQVSVTRDADGAVIAGDPAQVVTTTDTWVFARRLGDADPRWWVAETRG